MDTSFKGGVRYIFASLLSKSKGEHSWNKEKCFLFHFKTSFRSWDNRILIFGVFKCHDVIKCPSIETQNTFYWQTWKVNTVWWSYLVSLCNITKEKYLLKNSTKNVAWKLVQGHFLIFKDSSVKRKLRGSICWYGPILIVLLLHIKCK